MLDKELLETVFYCSPSAMLLLERINELGPYRPFHFEGQLASMLVELDIARWGDGEGEDDGELSFTAEGRRLVDWMNRPTADRT